MKRGILQLFFFLLFNLFIPIGVPTIFLLAFINITGLSSNFQDIINQPDLLLVSLTISGESLAEMSTFSKPVDNILQTIVWYICIIAFSLLILVSSFFYGGLFFCQKLNLFWDLSYLIIGTIALSAVVAITSWLVFNHQRNGITKNA